MGTPRLSVSRGEERTPDLRSPPTASDIGHPVAIVVLHGGGGATSGRRMAWVRRSGRAVTARSPARRRERPPGRMPGARWQAQGRATARSAAAP